MNRRRAARSQQHEGGDAGDGATEPEARQADRADGDTTAPARRAHITAAMQVQYSSATHIGRRPRNEDDCCAVPGLGLFAVADGMGGYRGGEVASRSAIAAVIEFFQRLARDQERRHRAGDTEPAVSPGDELANAIRLADRRIQAQRHGSLSRMGSTLAMLRVRGDAAHIAHVGDSRVYVMRQGRLRTLTRDHSYHEVLAAACGFPLPPRRLFGHANVILRALGSDDARPDMAVEPVRHGDTFLLCTDGVHDVLDEDQITEIVADHDIARASSRLVAASYAAGGRDNITAVVVRALAAPSPVALVR